MFKWLKQLFKDTSHRCSPMVYPSTGEIIVFHWDIPWTFSQTFHVCSECKKVKVLTQTTNDNRSFMRGYRKEKDRERWSGHCDYAKVPSIGRDKLRISEEQ